MTSNSYSQRRLFYQIGSLSPWKVSRKDNSFATSRTSNNYHWKVEGCFIDFTHRKLHLIWSRAECDVRYTETALPKVQHDIACFLRTSKAGEMVLLDLSAAFDTIDSSIVLDTMETHLGISETGLRRLR